MGTKDFTNEFKGLKISEDQDINILLLGETGVGKSTFINSIANYLHFKHFKKAAKEELLVLIPAVINLTDENFEPVTIKIGSDKNEFQEVGAAATQDVKTYVFPIGEGKTRLRLIDSPGMGDPRGIAQDDINCEHILGYLAQLKELHAICFLMKPTNARLTIYFEYCVNQILTRLEKSAGNNIIFIFTNTRGTNYTPGDTLPIIRKVVDDVKMRPPHVAIPLQRNIFSVDNESFKYLVGVKHNIKLDKSVEERFIESWNNSSRECWRLISYIVGDDNNSPLKPHQIQNTVSINEARRLVIQLSQPLAEISQLIYDNIRILEKHKKNLKIENQSLDQLKKKMYIPIINLEVTQLTQPVTVCTSTKCADVVKVGEVNKWHYRQRCHDPCYLRNVTKEFIGDPALSNCAAMNGRNCTKCTCDFTVHMHVYYMTKTVDDKIVDDVVKNNIHQKEAALREVERLMGEIDRRKTELEQERETVITSTAQFAHFLQNNAICPYSDSYKAYVEYLIQREKGLGGHADHGQIDNLEQLLRRYEEIKAAFDNSLKLNSQHGLTAFVTAITPQSILNTIHSLYKLKHNGKKIHELLKKQKASRGSEYDQNCEYVHPKSAGVYKEKLNKDKKQGKGTDNDEKGNKTDSAMKDKKKKDKSTDDERKNQSKKNAFTKNQGNRPFNQQQYPNRPPNVPRWEPPPPYPGNKSSRKSGAQSDSELNQPNVVVKVELNQPQKHPETEENPGYHTPPYGQQSYYPPQGYYDQHRPGPHEPYRGPPQDYYRGPPHDPYYGPPRDPYRGPPQDYYQGPPRDYYRGPPQDYRGPPQDYRGPPQGHYYGPPGDPYRGPPSQGPPQAPYQGQGLQYRSQKSYPPQSQESYQKHNNPNEQSRRGRPFNKRGGGNKRGRSKPKYGNDKKSGNEKDASSGSETSD